MESVTHRMRKLLEAQSSIHEVLPILADASKFMEDELLRLSESVTPRDASPEDTQHVFIPVLCLRFAQKAINGEMLFVHSQDGHKLEQGDQPSMYETVDELSVVPSHLPIYHLWKMCK